jgi:branched-chain amino acid transport system ATP-binding protein
MNDGTILSVERLSKTFGELRALWDVSFRVKEKELVALIGPNGAGKTTFYNVVTGKYKPSQGKVIFTDRDITGLPSHKITRLGLCRSFQVTNVFSENTVVENILAPLVAYHGKGLSFFRELRSYKELHREALQILELLGISHRASEVVTKLSYGDKRLVEIGIAMATHPKMVMLDEPTAGMTPEETERMAGIIKRLSQETEVTFFLTEHDMKVVFSIAERILVLHQGSLLAQGTPEEIRDDPQVKEAYLGGSLDNA